MKLKIDRRTFVTTTLSGIGALAVSHPLFQCTGMEKPPAGSTGKKRLFATTDYFDNVLINHQGSRYGTPVMRDGDYYENNRCFMDRKQLDELHKFLASVGVTRHQWIFDSIWTFYDDYPHGFDLLKEVSDSAHRYGIELFAVIKPFEGGIFGNILPHTMPCPEGVALRDLRGIFPMPRPFLANNPEMCLKRKLAAADYSGQVAGIRLVKGDDRPTRIKAEHLSILTSSTNNRFVPYNGPVVFRETIEPRYRFPYWRKCRVISLENLEIPRDHRYVLIRCLLADENADFSNEKGNLIELIGQNGELIPNTLSTGRVSLNDHTGFYRSELQKKLVRYLKLPEVQAEIGDPQKMQEHYRDFYGFGEYNPGDFISLDMEGEIAAACGKPDYLLGILSPVYPEVRKHWLDMVRFCLDRDVDGINLRISNHTLSTESWEYGFNEPVLEATGGNTDYHSVSRVNGDAYTGFLEEVRKLVKNRKKSLSIHLETNLLIPDDRGKISSYPFNFGWQWEKWVKEIGDEFEIRGIFQVRPWNLQKAIDTFSAATRAAGKPLVLQGDFHGMAFEGPFDCTRAEIDIVNNHPGLDGYVFYETANITRINDEGGVEGSPEAAELLRHYSSGEM
jgi:hypothetical protein